MDATLIHCNVSPPRWYVCMSICLAKLVFSPIIAFWFGLCARIISVMCLTCFCHRPVHFIRIKDNLVVSMSCCYMNEYYFFNRIIWVIRDFHVIQLIGFMFCWWKFHEVTMTEFQILQMLEKKINMLSFLGTVCMITFIFIWQNC